MTRTEKIEFLKGICKGKKDISDLLGKCQILIEVDEGLKDTQTGIIYKSIDHIPGYAQSFERVIIPKGCIESKDLQEAKAIRRVHDHFRPIEEAIEKARRDPEFQKWLENPNSFKYDLYAEYPNGDPLDEIYVS